MSVLASKDSHLKIIATKSLYSIIVLFSYLTFLSLVPKAKLKNSKSGVQVEEIKVQELNTPESHNNKISTREYSSS